MIFFIFLDVASYQIHQQLELDALFEKHINLSYSIPNNLFLINIQNYQTSISIT
jgi:hypothetical protein